MPSLQFKERAPRAPRVALAAEALMKHKIVHKVKNAPFNLMGLPSFGDHPMRK